LIKYDSKIEEYNRKFKEKLDEREDYGSYQDEETNLRRKYTEAMTVDVHE